MTEERVSSEGFFTHVRDTNPFMRNRITDPGHIEQNVPSIHQVEFERLTRLIRHTSNTPQGMGALLLGDAGIGKSHLVARVCRWADEQGAFHVFLHNLQSTPERIPRYILKCILHRLLKGKQHGYHKTSLFNLVGKTLKPYVDSSQKTKYQDLLVAYRRAIAQLMDSDGHTSSPYDQTIYEIIFRFFVSAILAAQNKTNKAAEEHKAALALTWLEGESIDNADAKKLGLSSSKDEEAGIALEDNASIIRVIVALAHFAGEHRLPLILFFDQVDNLQDEQLKHLSIFLHELLDNTPNLLVVTSGVQSTLLEFKNNGIIGQAAWARLAAEEISLKPIVSAEARALITSRLEIFLLPFNELPEVAAKMQQDPLFPLGRQWFEEVTGERIDFRPRDMINLAKARFYEEQTALCAAANGETWLASWPRDEAPQVPFEPADLEALIDAALEQKRKAQISQRELDPSGLPPDASNLCGLTQCLLGQCLPDSAPAALAYTLRRFEQGKPLKPGRKPPYHVLVEEIRPADGQSVINGLTFVVTHSKNSASWALRRMLDSLEQDPGAPEHVLLISDARRPLGESLGKTGEDYLHALKQYGAARFQHFELDFAQYLALDALQAVVGEARSGDVEVDLPGGHSRALSAAEVIASYHRQDLYRTHPLLRELLTEAPAAEKLPPPSCAEVDTPQTRQYIAAQLALNMGMSSQELTNRFLAEHKLSDTQGEACHEALKRLCIEMDKAEQISASPMGDQLYLMCKP